MKQHTNKENTQLRIQNNENNRQNTKQQLQSMSDKYKSIKKMISKKQAIKQQQKDILRKVKYCSKLFIEIHPHQQFNISSNLYINEKGMLIFTYSSIQVYLHFVTTSVTSLNNFYDLSVIDINLSPNKFSNYTTQNVNLISLLSKQPNHTYHQIQQSLRAFSKFMEQITSEIQNIKQSQTLLDKKNLEFKHFIDSCYKYLLKYRQNNPNQMFQYGIGRINLQMKDFEVRHGGYSKDYLIFLGLDVNSFQSMLLRQEKISFLQNQDDILDLSLQGLNQVLNQKIDKVLVCKIQTLDGFPVRLYQKKIRVILDDFNKQMINGITEYVMFITEFDVDVQDLKNLIEYRSKLAQNNNNLTLEEYMNKELSYLFEHVEYSVVSQSFIQKYYGSNLLGLEMIQQQQIDKNNQHNQHEDKLCKYRVINN